MNEQYVLDEDNILFEEIDGETVVINLQTGCYYSLNRDAAMAWSLACGGFTADDVAGKMTGEDAGLRGAAVKALFAGFEEQSLLRKSSGPVPKNFGLLDEIDVQAIGAPLMQKHDDIQEMLQLDPIHEVTDLGWPNRNS